MLGCFLVEWCLGTGETLHLTPSGNGNSVQGEAMHQTFNNRILGYLTRLFQNWCCTAWNEMKKLSWIMNRYFKRRSSALFQGSIRLKWLGKDKKSQSGWHVFPSTFEPGASEHKSTALRYTSLEDVITSFKDAASTAKVIQRRKNSWKFTSMPAVRLNIVVFRPSDSLNAAVSAVISCSKFGSWRTSTAASPKSKTPWQPNHSSRVNSATSDNLLLGYLFADRT